MCPNCRAFITTDDKVCPYCDAAIGPRAVDRRSPDNALGGLIPAAHFTTAMILLINIGLYLAVSLDSQGSVYQAGASFAGALHGGQWWRLITAGFLHGGLLHILMNSWVLFSLGAQVEEIYGTPRFLVIYFASTVMGFVFSAWLGRVSVGASAGTYGLIGAMIAFGIQERSPELRRYFVTWAVYGLVLSLLPGIDLAAHVGGMVGGFLVTLAARQPGWKPGVERLWRIAGGFCVLLTALAFGRMFLYLSSGR
jgi:rhomboid protease GluP